MKPTDLKAFRKANNLTQVELGEYLGCEKAFISAMEHGRSKLPPEKFTLLLQNPYGWDTTPLTQIEPFSEPVQLQNDALITELRSQIKKLEAKVDCLNQELGEKNALIRMMRQGGGNSALSAGDSLSADVG